MIAAVADTHTALWHLFDDEKLSATAGAFINQAAAARQKIAISSISLAEIVYLIEKNRLPNSAYGELTQASGRSRPRFHGSSFYGCYCSGDAAGAT